VVRGAGRRLGAGVQAGSYAGYLDGVLVGCRDVAKRKLTFGPKKSRSASRNAEGFVGIGVDDEGAGREAADPPRRAGGDETLGIVRHGGFVHSRSWRTLCEDGELRIEDGAPDCDWTFYGTRNGLLVFGSLTSVPGGKPRTSMMNLGS
jgi:hypothetical protein